MTGTHRLLALVTLSLLFAVLAVPSMAIDCSGTSTGLTPLADLGDGTYLGYQGGLYANGSNEIPREHLELGLELARDVVPRASDGTLDEGGRIGLLSIGVSNTRAEFTRFIELALSDPEINPRLVFVNGAQGARALDEWAEGAEANPWGNVDSALDRAGLTAEQVQVAWIKLPDSSRGTVTFNDAPLEKERLTEVLQILTDRYPNLKIAYLSSRIYAGYGDGEDAEPKAYQHGFTIKWLIEDQSSGEAELDADPLNGSLVPWIGWGPYLWADGINVRVDGLSWQCGDFEDDGIHPAGGASDKVARLLLAHFRTNPTASSWYLAGATAFNTSSTSANVSDVPLSSERRRQMEQATAVGDAHPIEDRGPTWLAAVAAMALIALALATKSITRSMGRRQDPMDGQDQAKPSSLNIR